jgi:hypothetical protein
MGPGGFVICRHVRSVLRVPSVKHKSAARWVMVPFELSRPREPASGAAKRSGDGSSVASPHQTVPLRWVLDCHSSPNRQ